LRKISAKELLVRALRRPRKVAEQVVQEELLLALPVEELCPLS
jgi:hypothetical protein